MTTSSTAHSFAASALQPAETFEQGVQLPALKKSEVSPSHLYLIGHLPPSPALAANYATHQAPAMMQAWTGKLWALTTLGSQIKGQLMLPLYSLHAGVLYRTCSIDLLAGPNDDCQGQ